MVSRLFVGVAPTLIIVSVVCRGVPFRLANPRPTGSYCSACGGVVLAFISHDLGRSLLCANQRSYALSALIPFCCFRANWNGMC